jgi:hypothetical protein
MVAEIHENAYANASSRAIAATTRGTASDGLNDQQPEAEDQDHAAGVPGQIRSVRPTSTAERAIGSERRRSTIPLERSSDRPTPVRIAPQVAVS